MCFGIALLAAALRDPKRDVKATTSHFDQNCGCRAVSRCPIISTADDRHGLQSFKPKSTAGCDLRTKENLVTLPVHVP